jgi:hypothetical protein
MPGPSSGSPSYQDPFKAVEAGADEDDDFQRAIRASLAETRPAQGLPTPPPRPAPAEVDAASVGGMSQRKKKGGLFGGR